MSKDTKTKEEQLIIGDDVWNRVVQIIQEGMLMGVDVTDMMRQIRVCRWEADDDALHLTEDYRRQVREGHEQMVREAERLKAQQDRPGIMTPYGLVGIVKDDSESH